MAQQTSSAAGTPPSVQAWDLPTRLFHWTLVLSLLSAWASYRFAQSIGDYQLVWHRWNGYFILILLLWRVMWGFAGAHTSRLSSFITWPWNALRYGLDLLKGRDRHFLGHNPLGTYMILALFGVVATQGVLGLFTVEHNDVTAGPLYRLVSEATYVKITKWHTWIFYWVLLPLVGFHILANSLYGIVKKDPLIRAMITGKKPKGDYEDAASVTIAPGTNSKALGFMVLSAIIVFGTIRLLGGRIF